MTRSFLFVKPAALVALLLAGALTPATVARPPASPAAAPAPAPSPMPSAATPSIVPVHIAGIRMIGPEQVLLVLSDEAEERGVPISVGRDQGIAIYLGRMKADTPRPMTHDLLTNILSVLGATIERITVTGLKDNVYFAEISLRAAGISHPIDARPSDAIALAVRAGAPMFCAASLLVRLDGEERGGIPVHADGRLGLTLQELDGDLAESLGAGGVAGVLVASVRRDGPADRAGVRRGDILRAVDGRPVTTLEICREALKTETRSLTVWRDGRESTFRTP